MKFGVRFFFFWGGPGRGRGGRGAAALARAPHGWGRRFWGWGGIPGRAWAVDLPPSAPVRPPFVWLAKVYYPPVRRGSSNSRPYPFKLAFKIDRLCENKTQTLYVHVFRSLARRVLIRGSLPDVLATKQAARNASLYISASRTIKRTVSEHVFRNTLAPSTNHIISQRTILVNDANVFVIVLYVKVKIVYDVICVTALVGRSTPNLRSMAPEYLRIYVLD